MKDEDFERRVKEELEREMNDSGNNYGNMTAAQFEREVKLRKLKVKKAELEQTENLLVNEHNKNAALMYAIYAGFTGYDMRYLGYTMMHSLKTGLIVISMALVFLCFGRNTPDFCAVIRNIGLVLCIIWWIIDIAMISGGSLKFADGSEMKDEPLSEKQIKHIKTSINGQIIVVMLGSFFLFLAFKIILAVANL